MFSAFVDVSLTELVFSEDFWLMDNVVDVVDSNSLTNGDLRWVLESFFSDEM